MLTSASPSRHRCASQLDILTHCYVIDGLVGTKLDGFCLFPVEVMARLDRYLGQWFLDLDLAWR